MEDKRLLNIVDMAFQASGWKLDKANVMQLMKQIMSWVLVS